MEEEKSARIPENRCGFVFPKDHSGGRSEKYKDCFPYCCYRPTMPGSEHCFWHSLTDSGALKEIKETLQQSADSKFQAPTSFSQPAGPELIKLFGAASFCEDELILYPSDKIGSARAKPSGEEVKEEPEPVKTGIEGADYRDAELENEDFSGQDLVGADFSGAELVGADFSGANLKRANFTGADLETAKLPEVDLTDANLTNAYFKEANLTNADLERARLPEAFLMEAKLNDANLRETDLSNTNFLGADFSGAVLKEADFTGANLSGANFSNAFVMQASLSHTDLQGANLTNTVLRGANLTGANLSKANLTKAVLKEANLTEAKLPRANLSGTDLLEAELSDASLPHSNLTGANLERTSMLRNNLFDANLSNCKFYGAILRDVQINEGTNFRPKEEISENASLWEKLNVNLTEKTPRCIYDPDAEEGSGQVEKAVDTYRMFEQLASDNALPDLESEMFVLRKDMQRKLAWKRHKPFTYFFSLLSKILFKYGESISRLLFWGAVTVFASTTIYANFEILIEEGVYVCNQPFLARWLDSLFFSTVVFATLGTVGFGPPPDNWLASLMITSDALLGSIWIALLIFVLGRWATR